VERGDSYPSLLEASAKRTEHEIAEHQYHHIPMQTETPPAGSLQRLPRRGAPKRID
jgi:peptidoglycan/xylan/chitin deacetylase (PgdA/CDA1 family)